MTRFAIRAQRLIDGSGSETKDGVLIVSGGMIEVVGTAEEVKLDGIDDIRDTETLMPGLWDVHAHFFGIKKADIMECVREPLATRTARAVADAADSLRRGVTSMREPGGIGLHLSKAIDEGTIPGPRIYSSGALIGPTAGHTDLHSFPLDFVLSGAWPEGAVCDGVPECLRTVRAQFRQGAQFIKVCTTGGVMSEIDHPQQPEFSPAELEAIVAEAARHDAIVATHAHGNRGIRSALEAGVRTIEHATYLDDETCEIIKTQDAIIVPTLSIESSIHDTGPERGVQDYAMAKIRDVIEVNKRSVELAVKHDLKIAAGTDGFTSGAGSLHPPGQVAFEIECLVDYGLSPAKAIAGATGLGPESLGPRAPMSGDLKAGYYADLLMVSGNPLADVTVLKDPANLEVIKAGELYRA